MQPLQAIKDCYDKTAASYAEKFINELDHKHFDRLLLKAFAAAYGSNGRMLDLGCGPGQTTRFLKEQGVNDITGADLSVAMMEQARLLNPDINFEVADMLHLGYADGSFCSAVAFYAIVNFDYDQVAQAFNETYRVLSPGAGFLLSFHLGEGPLHLNSFLDAEVDITFYMFDKYRVAALLKEAGFNIMDVIERAPYKDVEHPTNRAYIWVERPPAL